MVCYLVPDKGFQGSKLKVFLHRKKAPMSSMQGGTLPREGNGMAPSLHRYIYWITALGCFCVALKVLFCCVVFNTCL